MKKIGNCCCLVLFFVKLTELKCMHTNVFTSQRCSSSDAGRLSLNFSICLTITCFLLVVETANKLAGFRKPEKKYTAWTVSMETVRMVKSRPRKNQSERSDLPCHIINIYILLHFTFEFSGGAVPIPRPKICSNAPFQGHIGQSNGPLPRVFLKKRRSLN